MNLRAIPAIVLLAALGLACRGSSSQHSATLPTKGLPDPHAYAAELDAKDRYWWQQPERVVELLDCRPGMTVVDLGAGTGYFLPYLSGAVGDHGRVLALDVERSMIEVMAQRIQRERLWNVSARVVTDKDPALTPESVDRVLVVNTWHHVTDRVAYAQKLLEGLRPGGRVLIVEFDEDSPEGPPAEMRLRPSTVSAELESAGFSAELLEEPLPYQYAIAGHLKPN
jgi:predicted methyltransferase